MRSNEQTAPAKEKNDKREKTQRLLQPADPEQLVSIVSCLKQPKSARKPDAAIAVFSY